MINRIPMWALFGVPTFIIIVGGAIFFTSSSSLQPPEESNRPQEVSSSVEGVEEFDISGRGHIANGTEATNHTTNPPSSGDHWASPVKKGIYVNQISDQTLVHNLEHGYIWISYKQDISDDVLQNLKKIVEDNDWKIILAPRAENDTQIALAAWGRVLNLNGFDEEKIKEFIKIYRNRGPEKTPN